MEDALHRVVQHLRAIRQVFGAEMQPRGTVRHRVAHKLEPLHVTARKLRETSELLARRLAAVGAQALQIY